MIRSIGEHPDRFGVELICQVLRPAVRGFLTSSGYRAAVSRTPSARQGRNELLAPEVVRLNAANYGVYGRRKMHALTRPQAGTSAGTRPSVWRGWPGCGVVKSKWVFTTKTDRTKSLSQDLVEGRFTADGPRRSWVCDVTYVATWSGFTYVAFVTPLLPPNRRLER